MDIKRRFIEWLQSPRVLRVIFWVARGLFPVIRVRGTWMVFRDADVREVLESEDRFGVGENYAARMVATTGHFFLGMEASPTYFRERELARAALPPSAVPELRACVRRAVQSAAESCASQGEFDFVASYSRLVPLRIVQGFFGVPGPDDATLARWLRTIFWELFLNFDSSDVALTQRARADAAALNAHLDARIAELRQSPARTGEPLSCLQRMVALVDTEFADLPRDAARRNIAGIVVGAVDTLSKALVLAVQELRSRPLEWRAALEAARRGDAARCTALALEALRFRPHNPLLIRNALIDTVIGRSGGREKRIAQGERVFVWTFSASFDGAVLQEPGAFRADRPAGRYLHFGGGIHRCYGEPLAHLFLGEALVGLLSRGDLMPLAPPRLEGPFPDAWRVRLDPRR